MQQRNQPLEEARKQLQRHFELRNIWKLARIGPRQQLPSEIVKNCEVCLSKREKVVPAFTVTCC